MWKTYGERLVYDNRWVRLGLVDVEAPNGERWEYHVVHLDRIAIALIVDEQDRVLMLWRYRFPTVQWGYELLGGLVEDGEESAATAAREVVEETGRRPIGQPEHLISFEPLPGQVTAPVDVYLWRKAEKVGDPTDTEGDWPDRVGAAQHNPGVGQAAGASWFASVGSLAVLPRVARQRACGR